MRVFVTGATGFIGSAIVPELINAGHQVLGLAAQMRAPSPYRRGAQVHRGDLEDLDSLRSGAAVSDGVIHTAFNHDFSNFTANCEMDRRAIEALGSELERSKPPLARHLRGCTVGTGPPGNRGRCTCPQAPPASPRISETAAASLEPRGLNVSVMRLPPQFTTRSKPPGARDLTWSVWPVRRASRRSWATD